MLKPGSDVSRSKGLPWFQSKIGSSLTRPGRELLEGYAGVEASEVENHIYKIRDEACEVFPWPCIGEFWFVNLGLSLHPSYPSLLSQLRSSPESTKFLDLGTCLGQDLRKLVFDGVSEQILYGSDIFAEYECVGHSLFRDEGAFHNCFITADIFDDAVDNPLVKIYGTLNVISICMFLHIWDWDTQVRACNIILKLLSSKTGSMVIGAQTASTEPGEQELKPPFVAEGEKGSIYRQSLETFVEMWRVVEKDEGIKLEIDAEYEKPESREARILEEERGEKKRFFKSGSETAGAFLHGEDSLKCQNCGSQTYDAERTTRTDSGYTESQSIFQQSQYAH